MALEGIDYSFDRPNLTCLHSSGKRFVGRYFGPGSGKLATRAEVAAIRAAGMAVMCLAEGFARDALLGGAKGQQHATEAAAGVHNAGIPPDIPIFFAVDFQMRRVDESAVRAYLNGAASVIGHDRVGVYGGIGTIDWAALNNYASWFYQTAAWSGGSWSPHAAVQQYSNGHFMCGGQVDLDRAVRAEYGQWPHGTETIGTAPDKPAPVVTSGPWDYTGVIGGLDNDVRNHGARVGGYARALDALRTL